MNLTENNFLIYAANHYTNIYCEDDREFFDDLNRVKYLKKMFTIYEKTGEININLILNHIIILYNVFERKACTNMLFYKLPNYWTYLKSIIYQLGLMDDYLKFTDDFVVDTTVIPFEPFIFNEIKKIRDVKGTY